jgi:hypothetical protein
VRAPAGKTPLSVFVESASVIAPVAGALKRRQSADSGLRTNAKARMPESRAKG